MITSEVADLTFAAGALSTQSSFVVAAAGGKSDKVVRMTLRSIGKQELIEKVAEILGVRTSTSMSNGKPATTMTIQGDKLHVIMTALWPYLTKERKQEYAAARKVLKQGVERMEQGRKDKAAQRKANKEAWAKKSKAVAD